MSWGNFGRAIAERLKAAISSEEIESIGNEAIEAIRVEESDDEKRRIAVKMVTREVLKTFPRSEKEKPFYWHDPSGKKTLPKWRHCFFRFFTLNSDEWGTDPSKRETESSTNQSAIFDSDTETYLQQAIEATGLSREEVLKRAIASYSKVVSRNRRDDIETISTEELLNDPKLRTLPGRGEELAKRAIRAIVKYNNEIATGDGDRWAITQSIVATLTGVRPSSAGAIVKEFKGTIDDHNQKFGIDGYTNRRIKTTIRDLIDLVALQPDGTE